MRSPKSGRPKRKLNPASLANLRPVQKGEKSRNPTGKNGQEWRTAFRAYFGSLDIDLEDKKYAKAAVDERHPEHKAALEKVNRVERVNNIWRSLYRKALSGERSALEFIVEHMQGAIPQTVEVTGPGGSAVTGGAMVILKMPDNGRGPKGEDPDDDVGDGPPTDDGTKPDAD